MSNEAMLTPPQQVTVKTHDTTNTSSNFGQKLYFCQNMQNLRSQTFVSGAATISCFFFVFNCYLFLTHHKLCKTDYHNMVLNADCQIQYVYGNGYSSILILLHRLDFTMLFDHVQVHHTTMQLTSEVRSSKQCRNSTITVSSVPVDDQMSQLIHKLNYT